MCPQEDQNAWDHVEAAKHCLRLLYENRRGYHLHANAIMAATIENACAMIDAALSDLHAVELINSQKRG